MSFDKNENHGLEMHFKSLEVFMLFSYPYPVRPNVLLMTKGILKEAYK